MQVIEVKKSGARAFSAADYHALAERGSGLSDQARRLMYAESAIRDGILDTPDGPVILTYLDVPIANYHKAVTDLITRAQSDGIAGAMIEEYFYVRAWRLDATRKGNEEIWQPPADKFRDWLQFSSLDTLLLEGDECYRNKVPYSAYPFEDEAVFSILSGEIIIELFLNFRMVAERLRAYGWQVNIDSRFETGKFDIPIGPVTRTGPQLFAYPIDSTIFTLSRGDYNLAIGLESLSRTHTEFLSPDLIHHTALEMMRRSAPTRASSLSLAAYTEDVVLWR